MDSIADFLSRTLGMADGSGTSIFEAFLAVGIAYLGGILSSLTPCVYPMIPITVSVVGGLGGPHARRPTWREVGARGLFYVLGMTVVYSFLGVLAGITGKIFGTFTNTSGWYVSLGVIMTLAALVMVDVLPFDPVVWGQALKHRLGFKRSHHAINHHEKEMTWIGAFALGASSGFIAAPCTTPVLTSILAYIAKSQSVGLGMALMAAFSMGLGTLLLMVAFFAGSLQRLPRSGGWMNTIKKGSGLLLLAFAATLFYKAGVLNTL